MKKFLVLLLVVLMSSLSTIAMAGNVIGVKGGLNISNVTGDEASDNNESKVGFAIGGFLMAQMSDSFAIQPEFMYSVKGATNSTVDWNVSYLHIPILFKFIMPMEGMSPVFFAGPYVSMLLSSEQDDVDVKDNTHTMDYGLVLGGGIDVNMGSGVLQIDVRYEMGLAKLDSDGNVKMYNSNIGLYLGYGAQF